MNEVLKAKDYRRVFLLYGIVYATIPIIITEITWDFFANLIGLNEGLLRELIGSFLIHGFWDALINLVEYFASMSQNANADVFGGILFCITILFGITYIIVSIIKIRKVLKNNKNLANEIDQ